MSTDSEAIQSAIQQLATSPVAALTTLTPLFESSVPNRTLFLELSGPDALRPAIEKAASSGDPAFAVSALKVVWYLARSQELRGALAASCLKPIMLCMNGFEGDEDVQSTGCASLSNLCSGHNGNKTLIGKEGGCELVVASLKAFPASQAVQEMGMVALRNLSLERENQGRIGKAGGLALVLAAVREGKNSPRLAEYATAALWNVTCSGDNKDALIAASGQELVVKTMALFLSTPKIQENCAGVLANLASKPDNRRLLGVAKAIPALFEAMKAHPDDAHVQEQCCHAIWNQSLQSKSMAIIGSKGGVPLICEALKRHKANPKVAEEALGACWNLARNKETQVRIGKEKGFISVILEVMTIHAAVAEVQRNALGAIENLCVTRGNQKHLADKGAIPLVLAALRAHGNSPQIVEKASGAIANMCHLDTNRDAFAAQGATALLLGLLRRVKSQGAQEVGLGALHMLSYHDGARREILTDKGGSIEWVLKVMKAGEKSRRMQQSALALLTHLAVEQEARGAIVHLGAIPLIVRSIGLGTEIDRPSLCENGAILLSNLALDAAFLIPMSNAGAADVILAACSKFPDNEILMGPVVKNLLNGLEQAPNAYVVV